MKYLFSSLTEFRLGTRRRRRVTLNVPKRCPATSRREAEPRREALGAAAFLPLLCWLASTGPDRKTAPGNQIRRRLCHPLWPGHPWVCVRPPPRVGRPGIRWICYRRALLLPTRRLVGLSGSAPGGKGRTEAAVRHIKRQQSKRK